ncbi:hypothetical protein [Pseudomonas sp. BN411]|uniref:hypothetical protein n=1 Tax=Pseudomonas sp. BN411 TaxID=2567887 RepID=UPI0024586D3B|nr:hypothetical protein [Pseudomonas sp. BN411]MDH4564124.1 hypothetical protein [Pseudomonas sp. BN411]
MGMNQLNQQLCQELLKIEMRCEEATVPIWLVARGLPGRQALALMDAIALLHQNVDSLHLLAEKLESGTMVAKGSVARVVYRGPEMG